MKIFLSYANQDRQMAEMINHALCEQGHDVFFDRDDLPPGEEFHIRIRRAIEQADLFVFLISEDTLDPGSYTLNELDIAGKTRQKISGRLLPVLLKPIPLHRLPTLLKSVTLLQSPGNIPAAVADAVYRLEQARRWHRGKIAGICGAALLAALAIAYAWLTQEPSAEMTGLDGAPAVLIPGGNFVMGDDEEYPRQEVFLGPFYLDRYEITTGRYAKFLASTGSLALPDGWEEVDLTRSEELPVSGVNWNDAAAYCQWVGRRLPTDAEWEKAARGTDARRYPWGNEPPMPDRANYQNHAPSTYDGGLTKVGTYPAGRSPYGIHDLAGNVAEWVADWYSDSVPLADLRNPKGPASGTARVIRGSGRFDPPERLVITKRYHAASDNRAWDIGFRCARDP